MKSSPDKVEEKRINDFHIYPNPACEFIVIEIPEPIIEGFITISGETGQELIKNILNHSPAQIDISRLNRGFYVVQLFNREKVYPLKKIIIE